jgi:hypothetical protein
LTLRWTLRWTFKFDLLVQTFPHSLQIHLASLKWIVFMWCLRFELLANVFSHNGHLGMNWALELARTTCKSKLFRLFEFSWSLFVVFDWFSFDDELLENAEALNWLTSVSILFIFVRTSPEQLNVNSTFDLFSIIIIKKWCSAKNSAGASLFYF